MNILVEVKSFSLWIGDSICSLNKTQTHFNPYNKYKKGTKTYLNTRPLSPMNFYSIFTVKAIQVRKFVSKFVRSFGRSVAYRGLVARHSMRRAKQILAISLAVRGFHAGLQGYLEPSIGDKLACEREFGNCFDKFAIKVVNNGETVGHLPHEFSKIAWYCYVFDFILVMIHGKLQIFLQIFSQISRTPDFERSLRVKRCGLYAGVYSKFRLLWKGRQMTFEIRIGSAVFLG